MASSSEAFERLSTWKTLKTWLKVAVIERGQPEQVLSARISAVIAEESLVDIVGKVPHSFGLFDVGQSEFSLEPGRMVVSREDVEWLIFEEDEEE